jgi:phosphosulfolactate synthase (CoM biosynthesis protein A)
MASIVTAEVILRTSDGRSILDATEGVTADTIAAYRVSKDVIDEVSRKLAALGFEVTEIGPVSVTIVGAPAVFESVFQTKLVLDADKAGGGRPAFYQAQNALQIPEELASLVVAVTLPVPPEFYP